MFRLAGLLALIMAVALPAAEPEVSARIYGGKDAEPASAPWVAGLMEDASGPFCTGTLITPDWVISAAHCMVRDEDGAGNVTATIAVEDLSVFVDREDISAGTGPLRPAAAYIIHPDYDQTASLFNDIVLILLDQPVSGVDTMSVSSLAAYDDMLGRAESENDELEVLGWGEIDPDHPDYQSDSPYSEQLQQVRLDYRSFNRCQGFWGSLVGADAHMCAYEPDPSAIEADDAGDSSAQDSFGEDTCSGDSGGPLLLRFEDAPYLAGLTSFGSQLGCGARDPDTGAVVPGVYTRVVNYLAWIEQSTDAAAEPVVDSTVSATGTPVSVASTGQGQAQVSWRNNSLGNDADNPSLLLVPDNASVGLTSSGDFTCAPGPQPGTLLCSHLGTLTPGQALTQQVDVSWFGSADTRIGFSVTATQDQGDYRVANNRAATTFLFTDKPDLAVSLPATANGINRAAFDALIENVSDHQSASNVQIALVTSGDASIESVSVNDTPLTCSATAPVTCALGDLAPASAVTARVVVTGSGSATLELSASAAEGDIAPDNNADSIALNLSFTKLTGSGGSSSGGYALPVLTLVLLTYRRRKNRASHARHSVAASSSP